MTIWNIEAHGEVTEYYAVEADTEDEARAKFDRGDAGTPIYSEVEGIELVKIESENDNPTTARRGAVA